MGTRIASVLLILASYLAVSASIDCTTEPDGIKEFTCFYYVMCLDRVEVEVQCEGDTVFDPSQEKCVVPPRGDWPCGSVANCEDLPDGRYPNFDSECRIYYTCQNGLFLGHNWCPEELVFNENEQLCDWFFNTPPPCGSGPTVPPA